MILPSRGVKEYDRRIAAVGNYNIDMVVGRVETFRRGGELRPQCHICRLGLQVQRDIQRLP